MKPFGAILLVLLTVLFPVGCGGCQTDPAPQPQPQPQPDPPPIPIPPAPEPPTPTPTPTPTPDPGDDDLANARAWSKWEQVVGGMTPAQVQDLIGVPFQTYTRPTGVVVRSYLVANRERTRTLYAHIEFTGGVVSATPIPR